MRRPISCLIAAGLAFGLGGCLGDGSETVEGKQVFKKARCGYCHTLADAETIGTIGPSLDAGDLSLKTVIRQVTHGGPGMPAFRDSLSAEDIALVAGYVSSVAGNAEPVRFEPDDTTLGDCFAERACYVQAFGNLAYEEGPRTALARLEKGMDQQPVDSSNCHRIAHAVGGAALVRFDGSVGRAFAAGSEACASGYYHGIIEQGLAGTEKDQLATKARSLCSERFVRADGFLSYHCLHGLGHGLMLHTRYDLPFALKTCDGLDSRTHQLACTGGAFMENFLSVNKADSKWLKPGDLLYPCNRVAERHKYLCYFFVTMRIFPAVGSDPRRAANICRDAEPRWIEVCFRSFGREAFHASGGGLPHRLCRLAGRMEGDCIYGMALEQVWSSRTLGGGSRFCQRVPLRTRGPCYGALGAGVGLLHSSPRSRLAACRSLTPDYVSNCTSNAAVPGSFRPTAGRRTGPPAGT